MKLLIIQNEESDKNVKSLERKNSERTDVDETHKQRWFSKENLSKWFFFHFTSFETSTRYTIFNVLHKIIFEMIRLKRSKQMWIVPLALQFRVAFYRRVSCTSEKSVVSRSSQIHTDINKRLGNELGYGKRWVVLCPWGISFPGKEIARITPMRIRVISSMKKAFIAIKSFHFRKNRAL